jgi:hypothetical protein
MKSGGFKSAAVRVSVRGCITSGADENVFTVLAEKARNRTVSQLTTTLISASWAAGAIWWQHPRWSWLADAVAVVALYAAWGLIDRVAEDTRDATASRPPDPGVAAGARSLVAGLGVLGAIWTAAVFMHFALGYWVF